MKKITNYTISKKDEEILSKKKNPPYKNNDYSKIVVRKPWGYEYLIYQSKKVAVWILSINKKQETSLHAHVKKKTSLIVLDGEVTCRSLCKFTKKKSGTSVIIDKSTFHKTYNHTNNDALIMEIESPNDKGDLVRFNDKYGRAGLGYEKSDNFDINLANYNYITLKSQDIFFNTSKKYGDSTIFFKKITNTKDLQSLFDKEKSSLFTILSGSLIEGEKKLNICDTFEFKNQKYTIQSKEVLLLITSKFKQSMRASDYVIDLLYNEDISDFFTVPGDTNLHLLDTLGRSEKVNLITSLDETASCLAALGKVKTNNCPSCMVVSSGHSSAKIIEPVTAAYLDSEPLVILCAQENDVYLNRKTRQFANKSIKTLDIIKNITKYSIAISNLNNLEFEIQKAIYIAKKGRPGPVWIEIPSKLLGANLNINKIKSFKKKLENFKNKQQKVKKIIKYLVKEINKSKKPLIVLGYGIRLSKSERYFFSLIKKLKIPYITTRRVADLTYYKKYCYGIGGVYGRRSSNYILHNADLIIFLGARLSTPFVGRNKKIFAPNAKKIIIDIDKEELKKNKFLKQKNIEISLSELLLNFDHNDFNIKRFVEWNKKCDLIFKKLNFNLEKYKSLRNVNPYIFTKTLSRFVPNNATIFMDGGPIMNFVMQGFDFKKGQKLITSSGLDNEGFSFPASIGGAVYLENFPIYCLCEERTFFKYLNEINTLKKYKKKIIIICYSNIDFLAQKGTQKDFFDKRYVGTEKKFFKNAYDFKTILKGFKVRVIEIKNMKSIKKSIKNLNNFRENLVIKVNCDDQQNIYPKIGFSLKDNGQWQAKGLDNMFPFIDYKKIKF